MLSKSLPYLPGYLYTDPSFKKTHKKDQIFEYKTKTCLEKPRLLEQVDPFTLDTLRKYSIVHTDQSKTSDQSSLPEAHLASIRKQRLGESVQFIPKTLPQWLKYDGKVLRFYGYFNEHVTESAYENYRIRPCDLLYYLDDDTFHVIERKTENSQMPQGELIKKHPTINQKSQNGAFLTWKDIKVGSDIFIYGKKFRVCSCDEFTKSFFKHNAIELGEEEKIPEIDHSDKFKNVDFDKIKKTIAEMKEYTEVGLNGGHPNKGLKQFIDNDRKVLSFDITWYDDLYDKEEKHYKMNYYLADGQVEVCEIKVNNSGKDPFPRLLRKSKLPKKPLMTYCPGLDVPEEEYYLPKDFLPGNFVMIYNRKCKIVGCDEFTKQWYKDNFNVDMSTIKVKRTTPLNTIHPVPPHNGFGSEEDSLLNVKYLNPHGKVHEHFTEKFKRDKHILRFNAKLISPVPCDDERTFIISFYLRDNDIMVFETAARNSGRINCKFIEKKRFKNPYTNKYYEEKDMISGNLLYINKYTFKLLDCDEYTKKYMKENPEVFKHSDIVFIIGRLRAPACQYETFEDFLVKMLQHIDPNNKGYVSKEEIDNGFKKMGVSLSAQEMITLTDKLRMNDKNEYSMEDIYNTIAFE